MDTDRPALGEELIEVQIKLPRRVFDFLKNQGKQWNKTIEEYIDFVIQVDIAGTLIQITYDEKQTSSDLAFDLGLDGYIAEGKKVWLEGWKGPSRSAVRQSTDR